jgi:pectinesterase
MRKWARIALLALVSAGVAQAQSNVVTIALVGDSTVEKGSGWGSAFAQLFNEKVTVKNFAIGGRSSKSFMGEKRWKPVLDAKPDYLFIQFGHNDQPGKGPDRETDPASTFRDNLTRYVTEARQAGAKPILVSSLVRRQFGADGKIASSLAPYAEGTRAVAKQLDVPLVDLHALSETYYNGVGKEAAMGHNMKEGDITHLNAKGAQAVALLIAEQLKKGRHPLAAFLK